MRLYLQDGADDSDRTATNWCLRVSLLAALIVAAAFFVARLHHSESMREKLYGTLGVAFGTLIMAFLVATILLAVARRIGRHR